MSEILRRRVRQSQRDQGNRPQPTIDEMEELKQLRRENRELKCSNEILSIWNETFYLLGQEVRVKPSLLRKPAGISWLHSGGLTR